MKKLLQTWNEFFNEKKYTKNDILTKGFIFSKFPEAFGDISIYPDNNNFTIEEQKLNYDIDLFSELGGRYVTPDIEKLFTFFDTLPYDTFIKHLLIRINRNHYEKWKSIYKNFIYEYSLGKNYDLTETREVKHTGNVTRVESNTGTEGTVSSATVTDTGTDTTNTESSVTANNTEGSRYGFNSSSAVPTDKTTNTNSGTGNTTMNIDRNTVNESDVTLTKDLQNNATDTFNTVDSETISREGDLSVRAIQEQIQLDIDLWKQNVFYNIVLQDILSTLSLSIMKGGE